jgi:putative addiction module killer protein
MTCRFVNDRLHFLMFKVLQTGVFEKWLDGLRDAPTRRRLVLRIRKASLGNLGDVKPVGQGVFEIRAFFGLGWRMYFVRRGDILILRLGGGTKSTQERDIINAIALAEMIEEP